MLSKSWHFEVWHFYVGRSARRCQWYLRLYECELELHLGWLYLGVVY